MYTYRAQIYVPGVARGYLLTKDNQYKNVSPDLSFMTGVRHTHINSHYAS